MRVLLDECVPARLGRELHGHEVRSATSMRWGGLKDRDLLGRAAAEFDVLLTVDQSLEYQQLVPPSLGLLTIVSRSIRFEALLPFVPAVLDALNRVNPRERIRLSE